MIEYLERRSGYKKPWNNNGSRRIKMDVDKTFKTIFGHFLNKKKDPGHLVYTLFNGVQWQLFIESFTLPHIYIFKQYLLQMCKIK